MTKCKTLIRVIAIVLILTFYVFYSFIPQSVVVKKGEKVESIKMYYYRCDGFDSEIVKQNEYKATDEPELIETINKLMVYNVNIFSYYRNITAATDYIFMHIRIVADDGEYRIESYQIGVEGGAFISTEDRTISFPFVAKNKHLELFKKLESFVFK